MHRSGSSKAPLMRKSRRANCGELIDKSRSRGGDILITFFPGAVHDFDDPDKDRRDVPANAAATAEAMRRAIEFFANSLNAQSVPK